MKKKYKIMILFAVVLPIIFAVSGAYKEAIRLVHTIYPPSLTTFNYDMDEVKFTIGGVDYSVPEAYLELEPLLDKDGNLDSISIWASMHDDMAPWTVSESFKRKDTSGVVRIKIARGLRFDYYDNEIARMIDAEKKYFGSQYEVKPETYKEVFDKYSTARRTSDFYLVSKVKKDKPFLIRCPKNGNPEYLLCTVTTPYQDKNIAYEFMIPLRIVEQYLDYDAKVQKLIDRLIVKKGE